MAVVHNTPQEVLGKVSLWDDISALLIAFLAVFRLAASSALKRSN